MAGSKEILLGRIRDGEPLALGQQVRLTLYLCGPAIMAQVASVLLQFIDASMVGSLGANPSASIGLVSTTTWIFGGFAIAAAQGFSVQVAHLIGSNDFAQARNVVRQGLVSVIVFSICLSLAGLSIAGPLPGWLGGSPEINGAASAYFRTYEMFLPASQLVFLGATMLSCSGNTKVPAMLNVMMCVLDVIFNFLLIFPTRDISLFGAQVTMPGAGMGVRGAALGTGLSEAITAVAMLYFLLVRSKELSIVHETGSFRPTSHCLKHALGISGPMWVQNVIMRGAHIASTVIVAPLGAVAIAANSFAITAESFCYMPGYGMGDAATTLVGQSIGAKRRELVRSFSRITLVLGMGMMSALAVVMYFIAPQLMSLLSSDPDVVALGARVLRIEAFAEAGYAAAIVAYGSCVGASDTTVPSIMNLASMWLVRIVPAIFLTRIYGLVGYWICMCVELNVRGLLFIGRISGDKWMKNMIKTT
ncbi:MAG: MATE family efflux transporter [Bacteroidales bacterium]|nr:MATE family efflux transporter [Bacteroidales bacterium]